MQQRKPRLRGGWDCDANLYKSMGFTIGLPPGIYIPQTQEIVELSSRDELWQEDFQGIDSSFASLGRQVAFERCSAKRCYVGNIPTDDFNISDFEMFINETMRRSSRNPVHEKFNYVNKIIPNYRGQYCFVYFERQQDANIFQELKDTLVYKGFTLRIRQANNEAATETDVISIIPPEHNEALIISNIDHSLNENSLRELFASLNAPIKSIIIPENQNFAIIEFSESRITNILMFQIRDLFGFDCRRCFPYAGQESRANFNLDFNEISKYINYSPENISVFDPNLAKGDRIINTADIFNLDVKLTTVVSDKEIPNDLQNLNARGLKIFNVTTNDPEKNRDVLEDMVKECSKSGKIIKSYIDGISNYNFSSNMFGPPVVIVFETHEQAIQAQKSVSGREYLENVVITMLFEIE